MILKWYLLCKKSFGVDAYLVSYNNSGLAREFFGLNNGNIVTCQTVNSYACCTVSGSEDSTLCSYKHSPITNLLYSALTLGACCHYPKWLAQLVYIVFREDPLHLQLLTQHLLLPQPEKQSLHLYMRWLRRCDLHLQQC